MLKQNSDKIHLKKNCIIFYILIVYETNIVNIFFNKFYSDLNTMIFEKLLHYVLVYTSVVKLIISRHLL